MPTGLLFLLPDQLGRRAMCVPRGESEAASRSQSISKNTPVTVLKERLPSVEHDSCKVGDDRLRYEQYIREQMTNG